MTAMPLMAMYFKQDTLNFPLIHNNNMLRAQTSELGAILVSLVSG
jgi:hypothetical protein